MKNETKRLILLGGLSIPLAILIWHWVAERWGIDPILPAWLVLPMMLLFWAAIPAYFLVVFLTRCPECSNRYFHIQFMFFMIRRRCRYCGVRH